MPFAALTNFLRLESAGGILLALAALVAVVCANSPAASAYEWLLALPMTVGIGTLELRKPLLLWINDGLMAVFFLLVGLEIKREILQGELSSRAQLALPALAAGGGFLCPALIYAFINAGNESTLGGWAIPAATDIAFALGVLMLLGERMPLSLKVFLTTVAVIDDLIAIVVIAIFYTQDLSAASLLLAGIGVVGLLALNRCGVLHTAPYLLVGLLIWVFVLESGVHATLAGVLIAAAVPLRTPDGAGAESPAERLEHALHPWVAYGVLPAFAFANAGVSFAGVSLERLFGPVPLGIILGLFAGKQCGVFVTTWLAIRLGIAARPEGASWLALYGVSVLAGIGFTMSLFVGSLAFQHGDFDYSADVRLGVLAGSLASALAGSLVLLRALRPARAP
jgi:NhaA family Na+:H+ antiporter